MKPRITRFGTSPRTSIQKTSTKKDDSASDPLFLLSMLTPIFAVFSALGFVSGWSYEARYYDFFGLSISDADMGTYPILVHAIYAIKGWTGAVIVVIYLVIGTLLTLIRVKGRANRYFSLVVGATILSAFPITSWLAADAGIRSAKEDAGDFSDLPNITITSAAGCQTGKFLGRKDAIYFIARVHQCTDKSSIATGVVTVVPTDTVIIDHHVGASE